MANLGAPPPAATTYSICGFDIGSENCYIAVARAGGIEILLNDYSQRSTPAYVALGDKQRDLGVSAKQKQLMNMQSTFYALKRLVGRQYSDVMKNEQLPFPIEQGEHGDIVVRITHNDEEHVFSATQLLAMLFTKLRQISNNAVDCVINCPNYFTDAQKRAILDAAQIAGLNPLRLLPDLTAIGLCYGFYRTSSGTDSTVVFVDMGHTTTQCSIVYFKNKSAQSSMQVLAAESDGNLGGKNFDEVLADYFVDQHQLKINKRGRHRLLAECEKTKKQMSANSTKIPVNVECLYEDRDFQGSMNRELFEDLAKEYLKRIEDMLKSVLAKGHEKFLLLQKGDEKPVDFKIDAVEIVGGGSRVPAVKRMIKDIFGLEPTTTLNADEAVARGTTLQCAMLSPTFKVARELNVLDYNPYPINVKYYFESDPEKVVEMKEVFPRGHVTPFSKKITVNCSSLPLFVELEYVLDNGNTAPIGQYRVYSDQPLTLQKNKLSVYVKVDFNGCAAASTAFVTMDAPANGQADENGQPMETDQKEDNKGESENNKGDDAKGEKKPKTVNVPLKVEAAWVRGALPDEEIAKFKEIESNLILADKNWKERIDARNELEEYVYEWRGKLEEGRYDPFVDPAEKQRFLTDLNSMQQWLYADEESGETQSKGVYTEKINSLKTGYSNNIKYRETEFTTRENYLERLGKTLQLGQKLMETEEKVDEEKIKKLSSVLVETQTWFEESHNVIMNMNLTVNPAISTKDIQVKIEGVDAVTRPIMDELQRKKLEKQRAEEKRRRDEEEAKKKQQEAEQQPQANGAAPEETPAPGKAADGTAAPMDVDPQATN